MKFTITEFIRDYAKVDEEGKYAWVELRKKYTATTWDDLTNLLMSLIDFTDGPIKFQVKKEVDDEQ